MNRLTKRKCPTCKKVFMPKSERNIYHSRSCFKKAYYTRKQKEALTNIKFPVFLCSNCKGKVILDFDPILHDKEWLNFRCPFCSVLLVNVFERITARELTTC